MNIYLAGKIANKDYRHDIIQNLDNWVWETGVNRAEDYSDVPQWPIWKNAIGGQHNYTGPYFFPSAGHGCGHGDNTHGTMNYVESPVQQTVFERCKEAIRHSDLVFAWIERADCYGTIAEIGYAHSLNKTICIAGLRRIPDLWFVYLMAKHLSFVADMYGDDFDKDDEMTVMESGGWHIPFAEYFLLWCANGPPNHREYINSAQWNTRALAAKERAGWRCQVCNKHKNQTILDAHHRTYERLGWELPSDITVLCRDCHELFESNKRAQRQQATATPQRKNRRKR